MNISKTYNIKAWLQACRFPSQLYLLQAILLGHSLSYKDHHEFNFSSLALSLIFALSFQLFIVFSNDIADYEADCLNKHATIFSGGSRVLVNDLISKKSLMNASKLMLTVSMFFGLILGLNTNLLSILSLTLMSFLLLWSYSFPPFKLSYRGGGEILQACGLGIVLPLMGFFCYEPAPVPWLDILILFPCHIGCAIATSLPDEKADSIAAKRTLTVYLGQKKSSLLIFILMTFSSYFIVMRYLNIHSPIDLLVLSILIFSMFIFLQKLNIAFNHPKITMKVFYALFIGEALIGFVIWKNLG